MKYLIERMEVGNKDTISVGPWPDIAHYQTAYPWGLDDADYLFNTLGKSCDEIIKAIKHVCDRLDDYARQKKYPVIDAIYLRLFKGTNGGLSTSATKEGEHVCGFDIVSNANIPGYAAFKAEMEQFFSEELGARPHWGKTVPLNKNYAELYGKQYEIFMRALKTWHEQSGLSLENSPFMNAFFRSILQLPAMSDLKTEREEKQEKEIKPSHQAYEAAKKVLSHIEEFKLENTDIREIKEKLKIFVQEHEVTNK